MKRKPDAFFCQLIHFIPSLAHDAGGIVVDHDGIGVVQNGGVFRPSAVDDRFDGEFLLRIEVLGEQVGAGFEFMIARAMAARAVEEHHLLLFGSDGRGAQGGM